MCGVVLVGCQGLVCDIDNGVEGGCWSDRWGRGVVLDVFVGVCG